MALYLRHAKEWTFARAFILAGGLRAVADLVVHPDLHLRGQALETLSALTDEHLFPWHEPPRANTADVALHQRMLELAKAGARARRSEKSHKGFRCWVLGFRFWGLGSRV
jgi:hypothetical protein